MISACFSNFFGVLYCFHITRHALLSQRIHWVSHSPPATIQDVSVDHRCFHILMPEQFLNRSDVVPIFEQMRSEGMSQRVGGCVFGNPCVRHSDVYSLLKRSIRPRDADPARQSARLPSASTVEKRIAIPIRLARLDTFGRSHLA